MIRDPRVAFDQLFGAGGTVEERAARRRTPGDAAQRLGGRRLDLLHLGDGVQAQGRGLHLCRADRQHRAVSVPSPAQPGS